MHCWTYYATWNCNFLAPLFASEKKRLWRRKWPLLPTIGIYVWETNLVFANYVRRIVKLDQPAPGALGSWRSIVAKQTAISCFDLNILLFETSCDIIRWVMHLSNSIIFTSVGDLEPGVLGSITSRGRRSCWNALEQGTFPSEVLVFLPRDHE